MTELPGYSEIDPAHGEDEFIISDFTTDAEHRDAQRRQLTLCHA